MRTSKVEGTEYLIREDGRVFAIKGNKWMSTLFDGRYNFVWLWISKKRKKYYIHRMLCNAFIEKPDPSFSQVDHIDRDKLNNSLSNLRWVTSSQNSMNTSPISKTSNFRSVYFSREKKKWASKIKVEGEETFLGYYHKEEEAAYAFKFAAPLFFGDHAPEGLITGECPEWIKNRVALAMSGGIKQKVSKYPGVSKNGGKWSARITENKITRTIGIYGTEEDAAQAYRKEKYANI